MRYINRALPAYFIFLIGFSILVSSCSTSKNRFLNRTYHGLLARDNGYFNAKLKVEEGAQKLAESHEDKFDRILSIYQYATDEKAKSVYPLMDEAIKKVSVVIQRHSMMIKGTEYNAWIDDNYLLMARAQFYKHDYYTAAETFQYVATQYKKNPIRFQALIWLTQVYLQIRNYDEAETRIDYIKNDKKLPKEMIGPLNTVMADFFIRKKNYPKAIEHLKKAIPLVHKRQFKTRLMYILAQLYQRENSQKEAEEQFQKVIDRNPFYEMAFNAQMNAARMTDASSKNTKNVKKQLVKMLKDEKNLDYNDQIYYALAIVALKENDSPAAINYLNESIKASKGNVNQKALSFLELGKIYFAKPQYEMAQTYYDSTVTFLTQDHPDYENILNKKNSLTTLVKNLKTIALEDSLQRLAKLNPTERERAIEKVIADENALREKRKAEEEARKLEAESAAKTPTIAQTGASFNNASWYFYNPQTINFGYSEFTKKWGDRRLEDNWRRRNKESIVQSPEQQKETRDSAIVALKDTAQAPKTDKERYLKSIPSDDKQIEQSNERIIDAYYALATIYKEQLQDLPEAAAALETLLKRFPETRYAPQANYNLYRIYLQLNKADKTAYYKNIILTKFPETEYAKIISNPDYLKEIQKRANQLESFYEATFNLYKDKKYDEVIAQSTLSDSLFPSSKLKPKFDFLKTLSIGYTSDVKTFEKSLEKIVKNYPKDPVKDQAMEILNSIKNMNKPVVPVEAPKLYNSKTDTLQYYVLTFPNTAMDLNKLKTRVSDYNIRYFRTISLATTDMFLDSLNQMIVVKAFANKKEGMDYLDAIKGNETVFEEFEAIPKRQFLITPANFALFYKWKDQDKYLRFFEENYKKERND